MPENRDLTSVAINAFNLTPDGFLPVTESFSANVLHFTCAGQRYVLKQPFNRSKAEREHFWLQRHQSNPFAPTLLDCKIIEDTQYILLVSRPGRSLDDVSELDERKAFQIGEILSHVHSVSADDFDGLADWHELFYYNVHRYIKDIPRDIGLDLGKIESELVHASNDIPNSAQAVSIHLDYRIGNLIVDGVNVTGVIDFEAMRGGHFTMDFCKLWMECWLPRPELKQPMLDGYGFMQDIDLDQLMRIYQRYHGLGGLAWCAIRGQMDTDFARLNYRNCLGLDSH